MGRLLKSFQLSILIFIIIEVILFSIGFFFMRWNALCDVCPPAPEYCPPCPSGHMGFQMAILGVIPGAILSIVFAFLIKKLRPRILPKQLIDL